jgi:hypothetical protein
MRGGNVNREAVVEIRAAEMGYHVRQFQNVRFWNCNLEKRGFVRL